MIGWIILGIVGGLMLIAVFLLTCSVRAYVEYNGDYKVKVKYLFLTLHPKKSKKAKKKSAKKKRQIAKEVVKSPESLTSRIAKESGLDKMAYDISKANKRSFDFEMYKLIYDTAKPSIRRLVGNIRIDGFKLICVIGGDDAAKVALSYGFQSAAISSALAWLNEILTLKVKKLSVTADFSKEESDIYAKLCMKIRAGAILLCLSEYIMKTAKNEKNKANPKKQKRTKQQKQEV